MNFPTKSIPIEVLREKLREIGQGPLTADQLRTREQVIAMINKEQQAQQQQSYHQQSSATSSSEASATTGGSVASSSGNTASTQQHVDLNQVTIFSIEKKRCCQFFACF